MSDTYRLTVMLQRDVRAENIDQARNSVLPLMVEWTLLDLKTNRVVTEEITDAVTAKGK